MLDGTLLLGVFAVGPILLLGWMLALVLYYLGYQPSSSIFMVLIVSAFSTLGNFAAFFEVATATRLDGSRNRVRLLPFLFFGFLVSLMAVSQETIESWRAQGLEGLEAALRDRMVLHHHHGAAVVREAAQPGHHLPVEVRVQPAGRLVEQQQGGAGE